MVVKEIEEILNCRGIEDLAQFYDIRVGLGNNEILISTKSTPEDIYMFTKQVLSNNKDSWSFFARINRIA